MGRMLARFLLPVAAVLAWLPNWGLVWRLVRGAGLPPLEGQAAAGVLAALMLLGCLSLCAGAVVYRGLEDYRRGGRRVVLFLSLAASLVLGPLGLAYAWYALWYLDRSGR
jgi:hypothetical protein